MPDFELLDGSKFNEHMRGGRGVLLDFDGTGSLQARIVRWGHQIGYTAQDSAERLGTTAPLVRPDGIVAWAYDEMADADEMARAAIRWFGEPCGPPR